ncbi:hypothetical protein GCM10010345_18830 [Streptomyces canarius]|uniref:Uncharacterized protein n=1 Tax=Streptomyces canarius TaxID=285453 RepID=A0ABQ3CKW5_9ACTN|nr:hypothetical protein GCM10010345_18830 [Streptomyces canarius]
MIVGDMATTVAPGKYALVCLLYNKRAGVGCAAGDRQGRIRGVRRPVTPAAHSRDQADRRQ